MSTALITGINGQDGSYLAELLLSKGYKVIGTTTDRNSDLGRISHVRRQIEIVECDLLDQDALEGLLRKFRPAQVYNFAARASSSDLWKNPVLIGNLNALSVARILEAICAVDREVRFVQASSREIFGDPSESPQTETTPIRPRNSYGAAKAYAHWMTTNYREHHGLFACSSILFNHESPRRSRELVTRKISHAVAQIKAGLANDLQLGSLESRRDWGFAGDYVRAMWLMTQQDKPNDYVIATGETHSVRDFCDLAFARAGMDYRDYVVADRADYRNAESTLLVGDPAKARKLMGWAPAVSFSELVRMMVDSDLEMLKVAQQQQ